MTERDGWNYTNPDASCTGNARKLVTLWESGMVWVGIRAWDAQNRRWLNNSEPELVNVIAWRELIEPAEGYWDRGKLVLRGAAGGEK